MNELVQKLQLIKTEKEKITSEVLKAGITAFGITGTNTGDSISGIKLFETEEEMQNDTSAKVGDKCTIYRTQIQGITQDTQFQVCTFPDTVILDSAFTGNNYGSFRAVDTSKWMDVSCSISQTSFEFRWYGEDSNGSIRYTSTDGVTYTRTDTLDKIIDLGVIVKNEYEWNDIFGKFIFSSGYYFGGLYEYTLNLIDKTQIKYKSINGLSFNYQSSNNSTVINYEESYIDKLYDLNKLSNTFKKIYTELGFYPKCTFINHNDELCFAVPLGLDSSQINSAYYSIYLYYDSNKRYTGFNISSSAKNGLKIYRINTNFKEWNYELLQEVTSYTPVTWGNNDTDPDYSYSYPMPKSLPIIMYYNIENGITSMSEYFNIQWDNYPNGSVASYNGDIYYRHYDSYIPIKTQLSLSNSNELLPGKIAYGKNGIIIGDSSVYDNLDTTIILEKYHNLKKVDRMSCYGNVSNIIGLYGEKDSDRGNGKDIAKFQYFKKNPEGKTILGKFNCSGSNEIYSNKDKTRYFLTKYRK